MAEIEDDPKTFSVPAPGGIFFAGWIIAIIVALIATAGLVLARELWVSRQTSALVTENQAGPHVLVSDVLEPPTTSHLKLPATIRGYDETDIFAKIPGYLKTLKVDKGDKIQKGELLAVLTSPELDQQVATARANYNLALVTDKRFQALVRSQVIPQQTADQTHFTMLQDKAILDQDIATQQYEIITAPFDGIVTARYIDPGHLVPANTTPGTPGSGAIISVSRMAPLRVFVYVPQNVAPFIRDGDAATITAMGYAGQKFTGTITRHPEALSPDTRTMLVEVDLPNENQALYPGMYANAEFIVAMGTGSPMVPDDALIFRDGKVYVPVVRNNQLHLAEVVLGYDNGQTVEVTSGIDPKDKVAVNVGQAARDGENVQPVQNTQ
ncbi:MAG TPA: efflux RND transporter periplasmic adaptor subunit [Candidatus Sulfotelmatobacter sp.]|nr:efflux RND transporter periplasmic adaptor subunit [Candidatus Sulfotelmatobacter sp.]